MSNDFKVGNEMDNQAVKAKTFQGFRKIYHVLASSLFPLAYLYLPFHMTSTTARKTLLIFTCLFFLISFLLDFFRLQDRAFNSKFMRFFSILIRSSEENRFNGSTYLLLAFFLVILFSSRKVAVTAMLFLSLGDAAAELGGKHFGRMRIFRKSWEGAFFFFSVAFLTAFAIFEDWRVALLGAITSAFLELFSFEIDDNLTVPIGSALVLSLALLFFHSV